MTQKYYSTARPAAGREWIKQTILKSESRGRLLTMPSRRMVPWNGTKRETNPAIFAGGVIIIFLWTSQRGMAYLLSASIGNPRFCANLYDRLKVVEYSMRYFMPRCFSGSPRTCRTRWSRRAQTRPASGPRSFSACLSALWRGWNPSSVASPRWHVQPCCARRRILSLLPW